MNVLLDTHVFIWWDSEPEKLSKNILELLSQPETGRVVSLGSLWEMQIKHHLGKLNLRQSLPDIYESQRQNGISFLSMSPAHIFQLSALPNHHKDPFERILIAQALCEGLTLISQDRTFRQYDVPLLSA